MKIKRNSLKCPYSGVKELTIADMGMGYVRIMLPISSTEGVERSGATIRGWKSAGLLKFIVIPEGQHVVP
jgi:hypothetical protein